MPVCPNCGARNPRENTVCRACGTLLPIETPPTVAKPQPEEPAAGPVDLEQAEDREIQESMVRTAEPTPEPSLETQELQIGRAALFGLGAAVVCGVIWYLLEQQWSPLPYVAFAAGWIIGLAVSFGAGPKRGRQLQWISVGLTLLTILGTEFAIYKGWSDPEFLSKLWSRITGDMLTLLFFALALWQAYMTPAARRRPPQPQPSAPAEESTAAPGGEGTEPTSAGEGAPAASAEAVRRCARCDSPTTVEEALVLPGRRGTTVLLCPKCVAELEAKFAAETEDVQINRGILFGLGAAIVCGVAWFAAEYFSGWSLAFIAFIAGWLIAEAVRRGAGMKRGRPLQWIAVGLTLLTILGTQIAVAATRARPATDVAPAWSSAGKLLAYSSDRAGHPAIYTWNTETGAQNLLTKESYTATNPAVSSDGTLIAFQADRGGNAEIYRVPSDGSVAPANLTNNPAMDESPAWSPDGKRIVFQSNRDGNWEIYVMNADGTNVTRLTNSPVGDQHPAWSPDGTLIAFQSNRNGNQEIYVMNADGSDLENVTNNSADDDYPAWSADGKSIAFQSHRDGNWEIYRMNADGHNVTRLTNNLAADEHPTWSPDGALIAFQSNRDGNWEIYTMNADGTNLGRLTNDPAGFLPALGSRFQDLFTPILYLLGVWQAFNTPAARRLPRPRTGPAART